MKKLFLIVLIIITLNAGGTVWANGCYSSGSSEMCQSSNGFGWVEQNLYVTSNISISIYSVLTNGGLNIVNTGGGGSFFHYLNDPGQESKYGYIDSSQNNGSLYMGAWTGNMSSVASVYVSW